MAIQAGYLEDPGQGWEKNNTWKLAVSINILPFK